MLLEELKLLSASRTPRMGSEGDEKWRMFALLHPNTPINLFFVYQCIISSSDTLYFIVRHSLFVPVCRVHSYAARGIPSQ